MAECRHGISEDCPACMQDTINALVKVLERIATAQHLSRKAMQQIAYDAVRGARALKSAPVLTAAQNSAEGDPSVTLDCAGADTHGPVPPANQGGSR